MIAGWVSLALLLASITTVALFRQNAELELRQLLSAHVYNVMGAIDVAPDGTVSAEPNMGDPRFAVPLSGWTWSVSRADTPEIPLVHSASLTGERLTMPDPEVEPFDAMFQRNYLIDDNDTSQQRLEAQLFIGESDALHVVMVSANRAPLNERVDRFTRTLIITFAMLALSTSLVTWLAVRSGLRPLREARSAVASSRDRRAGSVAGRYPAEIAPLVMEINELLSANRMVVERAKNQVGNLAHALKTPLAVLTNEARAVPAPYGPRIVAGARAMEGQIRSYLDRAQRSQQRGGSSASVDVEEVVQRLLRVMGKLHDDRSFELQADTTNAQVQIEAVDLQELLGNVLDNAARHARRHVEVTLKLEPAETTVGIYIEDDGPGLSEGQIELALRRGERLDTQAAGSGLGLAIVREIVDDYGGTVKLDRSPLGGLRVAVILPRSLATSDE